MFLAITSIEFFIAIGWCGLILICSLVSQVFRTKLFFRFRGPFLLFIYCWISFLAIFVYFLDDEYKFVQFLSTGSFFAFEISILLMRAQSIYAQTLHSHFHVFNEYVFNFKWPVSISRSFIEANKLIWILEYRIYYVLAMFCGTFLSFIYYATTDAYEYDNNLCDVLFSCSWQMNLFYLAIGILFCIIVRNMRDSYGILSETVYTILVISLHYGFIFTIPFFSLNRFTLFIVNFVLISFRHIILIIVPIFTYAFVELEKKETSLDAILNSPEHLTVLTAFLKDRFCIEYLMFIKATQLFKKDFINMSRSNGRKIYTQYFDLDSLYYLEVPALMITKCSDDLDNDIVLNAFDEIADYILDTLLIDILRFKINY